MLDISIDRDIEVEKKKLESLPREIIVDQLLRAQVRVSGVVRQKAGTSTEVSF